MRTHRSWNSSVALFTMVGVLALGFVANLRVRPVPARFHEPSEAAEKEVAA